MAQDTPAEKPSKDTPEKGEERESEATPKLFAGKYRSIEEMERGYWQTAQEGLRWRDQAKANADRVAALEEQLSASQEGKANAEFEEAGIPTAALDARIEQKALGLLKDTLGPFMAASEAEASMQQAFPDFPGMGVLQRELDPDVAESYRNLLNKDPQGAMRMAYGLWKAKQGTKQESMTKDELIREARKVDAGKAKSSRQAGNEEDGGAAFDRAKYEELIAHGKATNDWNPLIRFRFGEQGWFKRMVNGEDDEW